MAGSIKTWTNGHDRSREAERRALDAARERDAAKLQARIAELDREIAKLHGYREATLERALADEKLRDAERIRLAARRGEVTARYVNGEPLLELKAGSTVTEEEVDAAIRASLGFVED